MEAEKCVLCKADFRPQALVVSAGGVKKCKPCEALYPNALTNEEIQVKNKNKAKTLDEVRVREIAYEILAEANFPRHKCEKCHKLFFRHKPMQKTCEKCGGLDTEKKTVGLDAHGGVKETK